MNDKTLFGGIEAGGTKFVCAVGGGPENIVDEIRFPTATPDETLARVCDFFAPYIRAGQLQCIGLGSFGPVDLDPASATFGFITSTPKPHWQNANVLGFLQNKLGLLCIMDTDVNAAALGEFTWGASRDYDPSLYLTVGTGVGGGCIKDGKPYHGLLSPEMGHIRLVHDLKRDPFRGACPFHHDCFEGLASGPAIEARLGRRAETLADNDPFWDIEADYIAQALTNYIFVLSPKKIVLGGGVMQKGFLFPKIRRRVGELLNGYLQSEILLTELDEYIVTPALGSRAGVLGAIALAMQMETS